MHDISLLQVTLWDLSTYVTCEFFFTQYALCNSSSSASIRDKKNRKRVTGATVLLEAIQLDRDALRTLCCDSHLSPSLAPILTRESKRTANSPPYRSARACSFSSGHPPSLAEACERSDFPQHPTPAKSVPCQERTSMTWHSRSAQILFGWHKMIVVSKNGMVARPSPVEMSTHRMAGPLG